jgi:hypothetical protein
MHGWRIYAWLSGSGQLWWALYSLCAVGEAKAKIVKLTPGAFVGTIGFIGENVCISPKTRSPLALSLRSRFVYGDRRASAVFLGLLPAAWARRQA